MSRHPLIRKVKVMKHTHILIIGSGVAALQLAKRLRSDLHVIILTKSIIYSSNSYLAQGGIAAAIGNNDNSYKHFLDTIEAGRHHNDPEAVLKMTDEAPSLISSLYHSGCAFDTDSDGKLLLGMEGAHSERRIVHGGGDATGKNIMEFLLAEMGDNVTLVENIFVYDILTDQAGRCIGAKGKLHDGKIKYYYADHVILAAGGCGQLYSYTSNAETITGDGVSIAYRAGAEIADMEFIQFHPTLLYIDGKAKGLISEAVRGEGAKLVTKAGKAIMEGVHPLKDLAPRHIVSQTIYDYIKSNQQVFLDIRNIEHFAERFPTITSLCCQNGIDLEQGLLPVVPGSHFSMGGVKTDLYGRTNISCLYAVGEVACTGVHGANRLASNSLLEGMVYGQRLADLLNSEHLNTTSNFKPKPFHPVEKSFSYRLKAPDPAVLKVKMMDNTGIVRSESGLASQKSWLESFDVDQWTSANLDGETVSNISKGFMLIAAWLITKSALQRVESRGGHFRMDHPFEADNWKQKTIVFKRNEKEVSNYEFI